LPILEEYPDGWRKCVVTGDDEINVPRHYYLPEELEAEFKAKTRIVEMVGLEGIFSTHAKEYNEAHEAGKYSEILGEMHLKTCTDPSMVSISEHFMLICKKCKTLIGRSSMLSSQTYQLKNGSSVVSAREIRE